jgi:hypothetical protein
MFLPEKALTRFFRFAPPTLFYHGRRIMLEGSGQSVACGATTCAREGKKLGEKWGELGGGSVLPRQPQGYASDRYRVFLHLSERRLKISLHCLLLFSKSQPFFTTDSLNKGRLSPISVHTICCNPLTIGETNNILNCSCLLFQVARGDFVFCMLLLVFQAVEYVGIG